MVNLCSKVVLDDVAMTTTALYFKAKDGTKYEYEHKGSTSVSFNQAEPLEGEFEWDTLFIKNIQNIAHLYTGFRVSQSGFYYVAISHSKFISIFNITDWKWMNHLEFPDEIIYMFTHKNCKNDSYSSMVTKKGLVYVGFMYDKGMRAKAVPESWKDAETSGGTILRLTYDVENDRTLFIVHKKANDESPSISMLYDGKIQE